MLLSLCCLGHRAAKDCQRLVEWEENMGRRPKQLPIVWTTRVDEVGTRGEVKKLIHISVSRASH